MIVSELVVGSGEHDKSERTKQMEPILRAKVTIFSMLLIKMMGI